MTRLDVPTYAVAVSALAVTGLAASTVPAWRAAATDPAVTLRSE